MWKSHLVIVIIFMIVLSFPISNIGITNNFLQPFPLLVTLALEMLIYIRILNHVGCDSNNIMGLLLCIVRIWNVAIFKNYSVTSEQRAMHSTTNKGIWGKYVIVFFIIFPNYFRAYRVKLASQHEISKERKSWNIFPKLKRNTRGLMP